MADGYVDGKRGREEEEEEEEEEEFEEEEIWSVMNNRKEVSPKTTKAKESSSSPSSCSANNKRQSRMIPNPKSNNGFFTQSLGNRVPFQQSALINIPDWSKIYKKKKKKGSSSELHDGHDNYDEWIARKLARNQISPFSVFEGRGRTPKGSDLSKVRNAILVPRPRIEIGLETSHRPRKGKSNSRRE